MINLWEFEGAENVRLLSEDGRIVTGNVIDIIDADEREDATEDSICIENEKGIFEFDNSEIKSIEKIY